MRAGLFAVAPSDTVGFVLQMAALGALFGTAVSVVVHLRDSDADTWIWPAGGTVLGAVFAVVTVLWQAIS